MNSKGILNILMTIALTVLVYLSFSALLRWVAPQWFKHETTELAAPKAGQQFVVAAQQEVQKPLNKTFVFAPHADFKPMVTSVATDYGTLAFSTAAGSLEKIDFKPLYKGSPAMTPYVGSAERNRYGFLVALNEQTPFAYTLTEQKDTKEAVALTYKADAPSAIILKTFTVSKVSPRIDMQLTVEPKGTAPVAARLFLPAPYMAADGEQNSYMNGILLNDREKIEKESMDKLVDKAYFTPSFFGAEDRYFAHVMIKDQNNFASRGYFAGCKADNFAMILEGAAVTKSTTWTMSFYCGPKDATFMKPVDPRLENILDYGWFSWLVKLLLLLLKWIVGLVKNYGLAILLLTLLIKIVMLPMTMKGQKALEQQKEYQRKLQYVEAKYKDDQEALNKERMELAKKYGVGNLMGCLPQLIQLPILFALNSLLRVSIELYQAPFFGWITDLSARDPYYILPLVAGVGFVIQFSMDSADIKRGFSMLLFAGLLVAVTSQLPAGLSLYLCANTWLSIGQTYVQRKFKL
jgi:YidC/Oxa1 family membrane protein insertase